MKGEIRDTDRLLSDSRALAESGQLAAALETAAQAVDSAPDRLSALAWQALLLRLAGRADMALPLLRRITFEDPTNLSGWGQLILTQQSDPATTLADLAETAKAAWTHQPGGKPATFPAPGGTGRRLRLGYVSGDLREHPVAYFLHGVLDAHDANAFDLHLISTQENADPRTEALKIASGGWHDISAMSDDDAAHYVRGLALDIAVDLSGWTAGHRLGVFRRRIAPVQMTWIGYSGTTGLAEMDYIVCDGTVLPPEDEPDYTETPLRLPHSYVCHPPPATVLPPDALAPRPAPKPGRTVFGSFNNLAKLTDEVIETWCAILRRVDGSLLVLRARPLSDDEMKREVGKRFVERGLAPQRLLLEGNETRKGMLTAYRKIDIALDPFPYGGTTTTFEALAMGVPLVTLAGGRWTARVGASFLNTVGLGELIASSPADYVDRAVALAADSAHLTDLRATLADRVAESPLCAVGAFTREFEDLLRRVWAARRTGSD